MKKKYLEPKMDVKKVIVGDIYGLIIFGVW